MPPLEVWEKVLIDPEAMQDDVHSYIPCTDCHGGQDVADKDTAHEGMVHDPTLLEAEASCGDCHPDIAPFQELSLHNNLAGYDTVLYQRATPENHPLIEEGEQLHCNSCHTTCGQCHVSQPTSVGGGLIDGHAFNRTPSMSRQCTACHGSRVKNEYTGAHEDLSADVHLRQARMVCTDCHDGGDMHGTSYLVTDEETGAVTAENAHRYDNDQMPACEDCHQGQIGVGSDNPFHEAHGTETVSCQVCHSINYINCYDCHLERSEEDVPYFRLEHENLGFYIGRNPLRSAERPYRFVPLRHVPTYPELFELYGENILDQFDSLPTWAYATPHNIQRNTPQAESCESCHGNDDYFLTPDKLRPQELLANETVIVPSAPPLPDEYRPLPEPGQDWDTSVVPPTVGDDAAVDADDESSDPLAVPSADDPLAVPSADDPLAVPPADTDASSDPLAVPPADEIDPLDVPPSS